MCEIKICNIDSSYFLFIVQGFVKYVNRWKLCFDGFKFLLYYYLVIVKYVEEIYKLNKDVIDFLYYGREWF